MANYFVVGDLGGGKSLMSVNRIEEYIQRGAIVATNLDIKINNMLHPMNKTSRIIRLPDKPTVEHLEILGYGNKSYDESKNGLIVFDECGTWFNSREWSDKTRHELIKWLLHARKRGWDIIFIIQNLSMVDKQARLAFAEHVVYCRRTDRLNIPGLGHLFKLFFGKKLPLPRIHIGIVKYGTMPNSPAVDTWCNYGTSLFKCYDTKQIFSDYYPHGIHTLLPPYYTKGRYQKPLTFGRFMRLTRIYFKRWSRIASFCAGLVLALIIYQGISWKYGSDPITTITKNEAKKESIDFTDYKIKAFSSYPGQFPKYIIAKDDQTFTTEQLIQQGYKVQGLGNDSLKIIGLNNESYLLYPN